MNNINQLIIGFIALLSSNVVNALEFNATTGWANRVEIGSQVSGVVTSVNIVAGQQVKKDEILIQLDQRYFKAQYSNTQAQLASEKEAMDEAKRELERSLSLYEQTILAEHELQLAKNADKKALANYKKAVAENTRARMNLEYSSIIAPFDAVVLNVLRNKGESINARTETPLMLIVAEAGRMKATATVASDVLSNIKTGQEATVTVSGNSYSGVVKGIALEPEKDSDLYKVDVEFKTNVLIRAGSKASIRL